MEQQLGETERMEGLWENVTFKENNILMQLALAIGPLKHFFGEIGKMTGHGLARDCGNGLPDRAGTRFWK